MIKELEAKRRKILRDREEMWRLRSRAIWLKAGDRNTKFFHNYAKRLKKSNTILEMEN